MNAEKRLLTDGEAASILRMPRGRVLRFVKAGTIPFVQLPDGEYRFVEEDLWRWVNQHKRSGRAAVS